MSENQEQKPVVSASAIVELLENGYVRLTKQEEGYDPETKSGGNGKSIQTYFGLKAAHVGVIFKHPSLKGRKTKGFTRKSSGPRSKDLPFTFVTDVNETVSGESLDMETSNTEVPQPQAEESFI